MQFQDSFGKIWAKTNIKENEAAKILLAAVFENRKQAQKAYIFSLYAMIAFATVFFFIDSGITKEIDILGIKLSDVLIIKWMISTIVSFLFYKGISSLLLEDTYRQYLHSFVYENLPEIDNQNFENLIDNPSFFTFERFLSIKYDDFMSYIMGFILIFFLSIIFPIVIIVYMTISNIQNWALLDSNLLKILILVFNGIVLIRVIILIISYIFRLKSNK
jgi:hypothetical protein